MKTVSIAALFIALAFSSPAFAKKPMAHAPHPAAKKLDIVKADLSSVSVTTGKSSEPPITYKITAATKIKINGFPGTAGDLRGGMVAIIQVGADNVAQSIAASSPAKPAPAKAHNHKGPKKRK